MLKIKAGDLEKLNLLYYRYSRRMFGFFYRMTHDGSSSEDLVQNVFMRVLKYKHTYSDTGQFESWLFQLARNVHHDHYRKSKRYSWQEDMSEWESHLQESNNVETRKEKEEEMSMLMQALDSLSPEKKELIELTRFQRMKYGDVANMLNITESAVKVRVHRVLKELREKYLQLELSN
ncbi:MAG: RNA polymerase sigma factor [Bacteroidota bacterium]